MVQVTKGNPRSSGYDKVEYEWYVEPSEAVRALFKSELFVEDIYDPACGGGTILAVACNEFSLRVNGSDIVDRGSGYPVSDFLTCQPDLWGNIITNPPFGLAEEFALRAIQMSRYKVAIFIRLAWLEGEGRYKRLFNLHPPSRVLVFRNRMSCPPGGRGIPAKGGSMAYCWVIWDKHHRGPTQLDWVRGE